MTIGNINFPKVFRPQILAKVFPYLWSSMIAFLIIRTMTSKQEYWYASIIETAIIKRLLYDNYHFDAETVNTLFFSLFGVHTVCLSFMAILDKTKLVHNI